MLKVEIHMKFFFAPVILLMACSGPAFTLEAMPEPTALEAEPSPSGALSGSGAPPGSVDAAREPSEAGAWDANAAIETGPPPSTTEAEAGSVDGAKAVAMACPSGVANGPLLPIPMSLDFGKVEVGQTSTRSINVENTGTCTTTLSCSGGGLSGGAFSDFTNCIGAELEPGESCQFTVTFIPTVVGETSLLVSVACNGQELGWSLSGDGVAK